jgi:hypothetical protein
MPASKTSQKDRRALKITHRATQCNRNDDKEEEKKKELIQTLAYEKKKCVHHPRNKKDLVPETDFNDTDCVYLFRSNSTITKGLSFLYFSSSFLFFSFYS